MGPDGSERGPAGGGPGADPAAHLAQMLLGLGDRGADRSLDLQHRLKQLVGDELSQLLGETAHDLLDLRDQLPRRGVYDGKLLLDPEGVARVDFLELYGHGLLPPSSGVKRIPCDRQFSTWANIVTGLKQHFSISVRLLRRLVRQVARGAARRRPRTRLSRSLTEIVGRPTIDY